MHARIHRGHRRSAIFALPAPAAMLGIVLALVTPMSARAALPPVVNGQPVPSLAPMLKQVTPAVVNISSKTHVRVRDPFFDDPVLRQFFGGGVPRERVEQSLGSGVIVDAARGYVLTNNHVVGGADAITVTLQDGRDFKATLVGTDPATDIAVLKIDADHLQALPLADSSTVQVGDFVVAVGDPFGLGQTVTSGIVSALNRTGLGDTYQNFIQTDASINPGNSGGALVNLRGQLIGINSMIYSPSGASAGIGFAIPTNLAHEVMQQLLTYGQVRRGNLGVQVHDVTPRIAQALDLTAGSGVVVTRVTPGSPADSAGLRTGDLVTAVNGKPVHSAQDLRNIEGLLPLGSPVALSVQHDGHARQVTTRIEAEKLAHADGDALDARLTGASLSDLPQAKRSEGLYGVGISAVADGSRAARNGLAAHDIVIGVNQRRVANLAALRAMLSGPPPRQLMLVLVRGQQVLYRLVQ
jgi:Do/DeqQ family serine protease